MNESELLDIIKSDEIIVPQTSIDDIELSKVKQYVQIVLDKKKDEEIEITEILLSNMIILYEKRLTLGGLLFFAKHPQKYRAGFCIKAVSFFGNNIGGTAYRDSRDIEGTIPEMFENAIKFFTANLHHVQAGQNFNSVGKLEISKTALEELLQNALIHRDYSKNAPIRLLIFDNRIEIISPGSLPNSLTIERIKLGNAAIRNNLISSYSSKLMTYRGLGSGIIRALREQPNIEFINDESGEQFIVIIPREPIP
jgi:predicted HTH transcriptional regulator